MQRYFNRQEVYVRDIQIEDSPFGPRQKAEFGFDWEGGYWTGYHSGKPSEGLQKGWNTVRFETTKVLSEKKEEGQPVRGEVHVKALKVIEPDIFAF